MPNLILVSPGDIAVFDAGTLASLNTLHQGHMVFCTAVSFSSREEGLLSVSGDASMRTISISASRSKWLILVCVSVFVLLAAILLGYLPALRQVKKSW